MGKRLLVVDSDRRFIQDHKANLESAFEVDFLFATEGVLARLEGGQYGAILVCVETSENKGYALCAAIRRTRSDLKIALISAKASEEEYARHRGTSGRADLYLHKPVTSGVLVPALAVLVPMREDDPDNPLGDLAVADLGDEWLESLKSELDIDLNEPPKAPAPVRPRAPLAGPPSAAPSELLEWRVKDLEQKLSAQGDELIRKERAFQELAQANAAVTRNLDLAQDAKGEVALLHRKLQEQEGTALRLQEELQAALEEHGHQVDRLEEVNRLVNEKTLENEDLMETHQLLQAQLEEAREAEPRVRQLEASLEEARDLLKKFEAQAVQAEQDRADRLADWERARGELENQQARVQAFEATQDRTADLERERDGLRAELEHSRGRVQELAPFQDRAGVLEREQDLLRAELGHKNGRVQELEGFQDRAGNLERELDGLRAQLRDRNARIEELAPILDRAGDLERDLASARDQITFQEHTLRTLTGERDGLQTERDRQVGTLGEQAEAMTLLKGQLALQESTRAEAVSARERLEATVANLEEQMLASETAREDHQREFRAVLRDREASLDEHRAHITQLEQGKDALEVLLKSRRDGVVDLTHVLADLEDKARQAMDLAKAVLS